MNQQPKRTNATGLTDDELILLDCGFQGGAPVDFLHREGFTELWNFEPHSFDDEQLAAALDRLQQSGLMTITKTDRPPFFSMTATGGSHWESERLPAWHRFSGEWYQQLPSGRQRVVIWATTAQTCDDFWRIGLEIGFFTSPCAAVKRSVDRNGISIGWRHFPDQFILEAECEDWDLRNFDWEVFEQRRTWWRVVREIDKFWGEMA
jgi:hypothetical protein